MANRPTAVNDAVGRKPTTNPVNNTPKTHENNTVPGVGKPDISGGAVLGNVIPNNVLAGQDIKGNFEDYNYNDYKNGANDDDGGGNGGTGGKKNSAGVSVTVGSSRPSLNLSGSSATTTPAETVPDTTIQDAYQAQMTAANDRLKQAYEFQQAQYQKAKDDAFREAYIKQQMVERAYPEQLAAAGIRGGAGVGVIARNNADYAKQRTSIYNNYLNNLATAGQTYQQGVLGNNEDYLRSMAAYQQALKQMELQHQYDKELAILRASLG